jgi:hypothetical protein
VSYGCHTLPSRTKRAARQLTWYLHNLGMHRGFRTRLGVRALVSSMQPCFKASATPHLSMCVQTLSKSIWQSNGTNASLLKNHIAERVRAMPIKTFVHPAVYPPRAGMGCPGSQVTAPPRATSIYYGVPIPYCQWFTGTGVGAMSTCSGCCWMACVPVLPQRHIMFPASHVPAASLGWGAHGIGCRASPA